MVGYTASAVEVSFSFHFCGDHFRYVCFTDDTEEDCCGENEKNTHCCTDKVVKAKLRGEQSAAGKIVLHHHGAFAVLPDLPSCVFFYTGPTLLSKEPSIVCDSSPPRAPDIPIYLKNRVLRI